MSLKLIFALIQLIGLLILFGEFIYVLCQKSSKLQKNMVIMYIFLIFANIAYLMEIQAPSKDVAYVGCILGYVGKPFGFITMFFVFADYCNIRIRPFWKCMIVLFFVILTMTVFLDPVFHWYYGDNIDFNENAAASKIVVGHGIFWYIYMASTFIIFAGYIGLVIYQYAHSKTKETKEMTFWLFITALAPVVGLALFILGLTGGYETVFLGIIIASISLLILFSKYHFFDSMSNGIYQALDNSSNGIIVFDAKDTICFHNQTAEKIVDGLTLHMNYRKQEEVKRNLRQYDENRIIMMNDKVYSFVKNNFYGDKKNKRLISKSYTFFDITSTYEYQDKLRREVEIATKSLKEIQGGILISFANLIEARDGYTGLHVKNVAIISREIAKELRKNLKYRSYITDEYINLIELASPLHDVGKIQIPDSILGKPGKLTKEEFEIMKKHTIYGKEIILETLKDVEDVNNINMSKDIALYHHEWFDGTGYPEGLKGDKIPLSARIVAVADVYDALCMKRPYKDALPKEVAINIIKEESGTHFDPEIVNAFLNVVHKL